MYTRNFFVAVFTVAAAATTSAMSLGSRQLGSLGSIQCNVARLKIVGALSDTEDSVAEIEDAEVQEAASAGLTQAQDGIAQIAGAIIAGEDPPQEGRDAVEAGLAATGDALADGDAADPAVADAQESLDKSVDAGKDVVAEC